MEEREHASVMDAFRLFNKGESEKAYAMARKLLLKVKSTRAVMNSNLLLAYYFKNKSLADSSIFYVNEYLKYNIVGSDSLKMRGRAIACNIQGANYRIKGWFEESKKWFFKGIEAAQKYNDENQYYRNIHGLALCYSYTNEDTKALPLFKECIGYEANLEIVYGSYLNIGMIYAKLKNYELSDKYLQKGLELSKKYNSEQAMAVTLTNLAMNAKEQGKLDQAIRQYEEAIVICNRANLHQIRLSAKIDMGSVFVAAKKNGKARTIYMEALQKAIELGLLKQQMDIFQNLKTIAQNEGNYKSAFENLTKYQEIKDSISVLQKIEEINELEVRYETLRKEREIRVLQVENTNRMLELANQEEAIKNLELQREIKARENKHRILVLQHASEKSFNEISLLKKDQELQEANLAQEKRLKKTILISFLIILIPIIGLLVIYYQKLQAQSKLNTREKQINQQRITAIQKNQELKVIKAGVDAQNQERTRIAREIHDSIGGNLAAIKLQLSNPNVEDPKYIEKINRQIDDTYQQARNLSHNLIPPKFNGNNFCSVVEEYIRDIGSAGSLQTSFEAYPKKIISQLEAGLQIEVFKIIQELTTNTIKHAHADSMELYIGLGQDHSLCILFEDDGIGFEPENSNDGLGFNSIKSRLEKVSGSMDIDTRKGRGTVINIEISNAKPTEYET